MAKFFIAEVMRFLYKMNKSELYAVAKTKSSTLFFYLIQESFRNMNAIRT